MIIIYKNMKAYFSRVYNSNHKSNQNDMKISPNHFKATTEPRLNIEKNAMSNNIYKPLRTESNKHKETQKTKLGGQFTYPKRYINVLMHSNELPPIESPTFRFQSKPIKYLVV